MIDAYGMRFVISALNSIPSPMTLIALLEADYKVSWEDRWAVCSTPLAANKGSPGYPGSASSRISAKVLNSPSGYFLR